MESSAFNSMCKVFKRVSMPARGPSVLMVISDQFWINWWNRILDIRSILDQYQIKDIFDNDIGFRLWYPKNICYQKISYIQWSRALYQTQCTKFAKISEDHPGCGDWAFSIFMIKARLWAGGSSSLLDFVFCALWAVWLWPRQITAWKVETLNFFNR